MILLIAGTALFFNYFIKFQQSREEINALIEKLFIANEKNIALQEEREKNLAEIKPQDNIAEEQIAENLKVAKEQIEENLKVAKALYQIGISSYKNENKAKEIESFIENLGYRIWYNKKFRGTGPKEGQIIYYKPVTLKIASDLKAGLEKEFNINLKLIKGIGKGVSAADQYNSIIVKLKSKKE